MKIAIIKYNAGNIRSVQNAIKRLGFESIITDNTEEIKKADKVIFPGVGEASSAMKYIKEKGLDVVICSLKQPVLGICLGLQLMCRSSEENKTECLGIFDSKVKLFPPEEKVPHMGWNNFDSVSGSLFKNINDEDDVYYVHSYYAEICEQTLAICNYILPFSAAMQKDNFYATQFHPEKSASIGEKILKNFLEL
ncbi:imidazole glycerol phosphate synthase subunit HisH [Tenacibaculum adriaticum]|uniref:Imidazole glycerol phosphate synthase subunit HisH n=1 Tax=Tenacibaculum adriaticum TaxID=413713 RepID=A0A5S5DV24_9FLAO|nr:imidazole glycerol phosphate synthase subunit HisH [Tenacibaculum adriaticum]TYP98896.1 imidazole glycerol phosphate synthase subunit HisH [Tenacibaculum adriaticum]